MMRAPSVVRRRRAAAGRVACTFASVRWPTRRDGRRAVAARSRSSRRLVESLRLGSEALRFSAEQMEEDLARRRASAQRGRAWALLGALGLSLFAMVTRDDGARPRRPAREARGTPGCGSCSSSRSRSSSRCRRGRRPASTALLRLGLEVQSPAFQAMTGALKLAIVVGYLLAIRRVPDIRRVFQYHGAEHKTISTYEAGEALTVDERARQDDAAPALRDDVPRHGRARVDPRLHGDRRRSCRASTPGSALLDNVVFFLEKLPFLPVIVAVTFEIQRLFARYCTTGPLRAAALAGLPRAEDHDDRARRRAARGRAREPAGDALPPGARGEPRAGAEDDVSFPELRGPARGGRAASGRFAAPDGSAERGRPFPCSRSRSSSSSCAATASSTSSCAGPTCWPTATKLQKLNKERSDLEPLVDAVLALPRRSRRRSATTRRRSAIPSCASSRRPSCPDLAASDGRLEAVDPAAAPAARSERQEEHDPRDPQRRGRRRGGALRGGSLPHVRALRRDARAGRSRC